MNKPFWKSKTFLVALGSLVIVFLTNLEQYLSSSEAVTLMGVLMIVLRAITKESVKWGL